MQFTLYRTSNFAHLTGNNLVEVMIGTYEECESKAAELQAKGFTTYIY